MTSHLDHQGELVNKMIDRGELHECIAYIKKIPGAQLDHWLLARLAYIYALLGNVEDAWRSICSARQLKPRCPLVLWEVAGMHELRGEYEHAIDVYKGLLKRSVDSIAYGDCGEGTRFARSLLIDSRAGLAHCYRNIGKTDLALAFYREHLAMRVRGMPSTCSRKEIEKIIKRLERSRS